MIRLILARHLTKCGAAGSQKLQDLRARQMTQVVGPMHYQIARIVEARLSLCPADGGLEDVDSILQPVADAEVAKQNVPAGTAVPPSLCRKVMRCLCDSAEALVERGIVTSGETLARVIPQFTSGLRAQAFDDPELRRVYASIYRAFRRRRSLLLLNLEKQVRIEELPWVAAMEAYRRRDVSTRDLSRQTLRDVAAVTLRAFPYAILPNNLLQEFAALAKGGEMDLPLVEELAADIFMDKFSPKFTRAAKLAASFVEGSLYARYYGLDAAAVRSLPDDQQKQGGRWPWSKPSAPGNALASLCTRRAGVGALDWNVVRNGMVIEQAQILTTHNLAILFTECGLDRELRNDLRGMAERCFLWICRRLQVRNDNWHGKLIMLKQTAYAWRQMIFFLSRLGEHEADDFPVWARAVLAREPEDFRSGFAPAMRGLGTVCEGGMLEDSPEARRFLGWTKKRHWLLGGVDEPQGKG